MIDVDALVKKVNYLRTTIERNKGRRDQLLNLKKQELSNLKEKFNVNSVKEGKELLMKKEKQMEKLTEKLEDIENELKEIM